MKNLNIDAIKTAHRALQEAIATLHSTNPALVESDEENYTDSYKLLYLPLRDGGEQEYINHALQSDAEFPDDCLAALLVEAMRNSTPICKTVDSLCLDRVGTRYRFCISGEISSAKLQQLCEQHRELHGQEEKK